MMLPTPLSSTCRCYSPQIERVYLYYPSNSVWENGRTKDSLTPFFDLQELARDPAAVEVAAASRSPRAALASAPRLHSERVVILPTGDSKRLQAPAAAPTYSTEVRGPAPSSSRCALH